MGKNILQTQLLPPSNIVASFRSLFSLSLQKDSKLPFSDRLLQDMAQFLRIFTTFQKHCSYEPEETLIGLRVVKVNVALRKETYVLWNS